MHLDDRSFGFNGNQIRLFLKDPFLPTGIIQTFRNTIIPENGVAVLLEQRRGISRNDRIDIGRGAEPLELAVLTETSDTFVRIERWIRYSDFHTFLFNSNLSIYFIIILKI